MSKTERNHDVTRRELLAIIFGLKTYKQYVPGRHFVIRTDHAALQWLRKAPEPMAQFARWLTFIEQFDFKVSHRAGSKHGNGDRLLRKPADQLNEGFEAGGVTANDTSSVVVDSTGVASSSAGEPLADLQLRNPEIGQYSGSVYSKNKRLVCLTYYHNLNQ